MFYKSYEIRTVYKSCSHSNGLVIWITIKDNNWCVTEFIIKTWQWTCAGYFNVPMIRVAPRLTTFHNLREIYSYLCRVKPVSSSTILSNETVTTGNSNVYSFKREEVLPRMWFELGSVFIFHFTNMPHYNKYYHVFWFPSGLLTLLCSTCLSPLCYRFSTFIP